MATMTITNEYLHQIAEQVDTIFQSHAFAAGVDAGFDGGEWSGPAHFRAAEDEATAYCAAHCVPLEVVMDYMWYNEQESLFEGLTSIRGQ